MIRRGGRTLPHLSQFELDIICKDKGLTGDLVRLPILTRIMFLKFLDDLELQRED